MLDLFIIGGGPAGMTALLYGAFYGLKAVCVGDTIGGKLLQAPNVIDYPGFTSVAGNELVRSLQKQIETVQGNLRIADVIHVRKKTHEKKPFFTTYISGEEKYISQTLLFATGNPNKQAAPKAPRLAELLSVSRENELFIVDHEGKTNIPGVFAAGDCVTFPYSLEQITTATSTAVQAVVGVYHYLKNSPPPIIWGTSTIPRTSR